MYDQLVLLSLPAPQQMAHHPNVPQLSYHRNISNTSFIFRKKYIHCKDMEGFSLIGPEYRYMENLGMETVSCVCEVCARVNCIENQVNVNCQNPIRINRIMQQSS